MKLCKYQITNLNEQIVIQNFNHIPSRNDFDILIFTEAEYLGKMEETPNEEELHNYSVLQAILNSLSQMSDLSTTRFKLELLGDVEAYDHLAFSTLCRNFLDGTHPSGIFPPSMYEVSKEDKCFYLGLVQAPRTLH